VYQAPVTPPNPDAYYLIESNGAINAFAGAATFGSKLGAVLSSPIIGGATTSDGGGYWIVTARGNIYNYGDALFLGSPVHMKLAAPIVAFAASPDDQGYWLLAANGAVYNYGDAYYCGSAVHAHAKSPFVGFAPTPDGLGYYLVTSRGIVYDYGDGIVLRAPARQAKRTKITSIAADPNGGYWLLAAKGAIYPSAGTPFFGSAVHEKLKKVPLISIASSASGLGYFVTTSDGRVFNYGDATFAGSDAHARPRRPVTVVALLRAVAVPTASVPEVPHHVFGYDVSNFQCSKSGATTIGKGLPTTSAFTVIEAAGWLDDANNSCLKAEAAWATAAAGADATPYDLYQFVNSPDTSTGSTALAASGPKGTCGAEAATAKAECIAYNYGYNGSRASFTYAHAANVSSTLWWLDIENPNLSGSAYSNFSASQYWSYSKVLNDETIQGAIDGLRSEGVTVGLYSTSVQYPEIAGNFVPSGARVPIWIAGTPWTSPPYSESGLQATTVLANWCSGNASYTGTPGGIVFANGVPWLLQETPGLEASPYGLDPDYTC
jgi:hypothetical protein